MKMYRILICLTLCFSLISVNDVGVVAMYGFQKDGQNSAKADDLLRRAREQQSIQPDSALSLARQALVIYTAQGNDTAEMSARQLIAAILTKLGGIAEAEDQLHLAKKFYENKGSISQQKDNAILLGILYDRSGKYNSAIDQYNKAIEFAKSESDAKNLGLCYNNLGVIYEVLGDYSRALNNYYEALNYKSKIGDEIGKASVFNNIGNIYKVRGDLDVALDYHQKSLAIRKQQSDELGEAMSLNNIGTIYKAKGSLEQASVAFADALKIARNLWDKRLVGRIYANIAGIYLIKRELTDAMRYYEKAIAIFEEQRDNSSLASCYNIYGAIQYEIRNPQSAIVFLKKSLAVATASGYRASLKETLGSLAACYAGMGQYDSAFVYQAKFSAILDSISSTSVKDNISKVQMRYEAERRNAEIQSLTKTREETNLALLDAQKHMEQLRTSQFHSEEQNKELQKQSLSNEFLLTTMTEAAEKQRLASEHKQQQIQLLKKSKQLADSELNKQQLWIWFGGSVSILLSLITGLLLRTTSITKRHTADLENNNKRIAEKASQLEQQKNEIISQKEELAKLTDVVTRKNTELEEKNEALNHMNLERDQLLSQAMHDVKNSLSGIKMLSDILATVPEQLNANEIKEFGTSIKGSSEHLFHVIKGLNEINAIERETYPLNIQPVLCSELLWGVLQKNTASAENKNINIIYQPQFEETFVKADANALFNILNNLVSNAIAYSPKNSSVIVKSVITQHDDSRYLQFSVTDQGPGFTEQDKSKLYSIFAKLSAQPTGSEFTTGLGLAIAKKLADATNGIIDLSDTSPAGSTFTVAYPIATEVQHYSNAEASAA